MEKREQSHTFFKQNFKNYREQLVSISYGVKPKIIHTPEKVISLS